MTGPQWRITICFNFSCGLNTGNLEKLGERKVAQAALTPNYAFGCVAGGLVVSADTVHLSPQQATLLLCLSRLNLVNLPRNAHVKTSVQEDYVISQCHGHHFPYIVVQ